uniref:Cleavage and polyadenylation specificity factor subunit 2 n=1 Tax=Strigamia maritima TaxID=126957 RepID=T1J8Y7_STRMM
MASVIKFNVLSDVSDETSHCYILRVDEFCFLLDCGWDDKFNPLFIEELKKHVYSIDAVLLSYPDNYHLGALPYAVGKLGLSCPI